jgi:hypothetical protein
MVARQVARSVTSLLRTRRPFKLVVFALLTLLLFFKGLYWDHDSDVSPSKTSPAFPLGGSKTTNLTPIPVLGQHRFRVDGLMEVNEDGAHPIYELMSRAEQEWKDKLKRASKTLRDAADEYRRRYNRRPPKGFDLW